MRGLNFIPQSSSMATAKQEHDSKWTKLAQATWHRSTEILGKAPVSHVAVIEDRCGLDVHSHRGAIPEETANNQKTCLHLAHFEPRVHLTVVHHVDPPVTRHQPLSQQLAALACGRALFVDGLRGKTTAEPHEINTFNRRQAGSPSHLAKTFGGLRMCGVN